MEFGIAMSPRGEPCPVCPQSYRYAEIVYQRLSGVPATHSLASVDEKSVTITDLDDTASALGSHDIEVAPMIAGFFRR
jgi:hypothetical protein